MLSKLLLLIIFFLYRKRENGDTNSKYKNLLLKYLLTKTFSYFLLGILREDTLPLLEPPAKLSVSQERTFQYVLNISSTMETVADDYDDQEIDLDIEPHIQVRL